MADLLQAMIDEISKHTEWKDILTMWDRWLKRWASSFGMVRGCIRTKGLSGLLLAPEASEARCRVNEHCQMCVYSGFESNYMPNLYPNLCTQS